MRECGRPCPPALVGTGLNGNVRVWLGLRNRFTDPAKMGRRQWNYIRTLKRREERKFRSLEWIKRVLEWIKRVLEWIKRVVEWINRIQEWIKRVLEWIKQHLEFTKRIQEWIKEHLEITKNLFNKTFWIFLHLGNIRKVLVKNFPIIICYKQA